MARRNQDSAGATSGMMVADRETTEQGYGVASTSTTYKPGPSTTTTIPAPRLTRPRGSPDTLRRNSAGALVPILEEEPTHMEFSNQHVRQFSGSVVVDMDESDDEEVEEWLLEQELAKEGLYRGSFKRLIAFYSLVPFTTIMTFALLAVLPLVAYRLDPDSPHSPYPYSPYLPYPLPEMLIAAALWSMSLLLREFVFSLSSSISASLGPYTSMVLSLLATSVQTIITVLLQLASVVLLLIGPSPGFTHPTWHDHAFRRVWTVALGWAGVEAIVGIKQGYENITLYRDVLVHVKRISPEDAQIPTERSSYSEHSSPGITRQTTRGSQELLFEEPHGERQPLLQKLPQVNGVYRFSRKAIEREVQNDLDLLVALKAREELEEIYGIPVIHIPVFISCLHRVNAVLNSLGTFLLLSAAYLRSPLAPSVPERIHTFYPLNLLPHIVAEALKKQSRTLLSATLAGVILCQLTLGLLHTAWVLPRIGVATYVYIALLVSLALFFSGLAFWEALV
ncbi:hypothetical protein FA13DRAFT_1730007 [Coprinellus micaceus]|uniref:Uncharacterized protein n=1 Tax=Coprinellus micaceus TaxID=71717 RepID=A0A4Y7THS8_COPMI|nr:hypothetical protein FA13DRAFT_1730007 [Coprinellus micaceus]